MKRNAIVRICVYAGLILLLTVILCVGIFGIGLRGNSLIDRVIATSPPMSEAAVPVTSPMEDRLVLATGRCLYDLDAYSSPTSGALCSGRLIKGESVNILEIRTTNGEEWAYVSGQCTGWVQVPLLEIDGTVPLSPETAASESICEDTLVLESGIGTAIATDNLNIRSAPSLVAPSMELLKKGEQVTILITQDSMGVQWAYIQRDDTRGWVSMEYLSQDGDVPESAIPETSEEEVPDTSVTLLEEGEPGLRKFYQSISSLDVEWLSGEIMIRSGDVEAVEASFGDAPADFTVTDRGRLKVQQAHHMLSFKKDDLTITLPRGLTLEKLELDTGSGVCHLENLTVQELEIDTASGPCTLENLTVGELDIDSASGKVKFTGSVERLDFDGASASLTAIIENRPKKLNLETASANLDITLPKDCGVTIDFESTSGRLSTDFDTRSTDGGRTYGDGSCKIKVETMSGWVNIHQSASQGRDGT